MRSSPGILWQICGLIRCPAPSTASKRPQGRKGQIRFLATRSRLRRPCNSSYAGTGTGRPGAAQTGSLNSCGLCDAIPIFPRLHTEAWKVKPCAAFLQSGPGKENRWREVAFRHPDLGPRRDCTGLRGMSGGEQSNAEKTRKVSSPAVAKGLGEGDCRRPADPRLRRGQDSAEMAVEAEE